jgi:hypothetical protein
VAEPGQRGIAYVFRPNQSRECIHEMDLFFASPIADILNPQLPLFRAYQYLDNVIGAGSPKFDQAYFEVNYLRAYTTGLPTPSPTGAISNVGSNKLPSQRNSGTSSDPGPLLSLSLVVITTLSLICAS